METKNHFMRFLPMSLRGIIVASSYWLLSLSLTVLSGSVAAVLGCIAACYLIDSRIKRPPLISLRTSSIAGGCLLIGVAGYIISSSLVKSALLSNLASPLFAYNVSEFVQWFCISTAITILLRTLAKRTNYGAVVEILFVATAFVITLSAHRNGMIHRPFFIGDYALTRGIDPSTILMAFGSVGVLSLAALLIIETSHKRLLYHFSILGTLCFSLLIYVRLFGLPTPQLTNDLGLTGQEQSGSNSQRENPFRDGENEANDKEAPVAVVVFRDDYESSTGSYYFRESAYSQFNGNILGFTSRDDMDQDLIEQYTQGRTNTEQLPGSEDKRTAVRTTIGMLVSHRTPFGLDSPIAYEDTPNPNNLRFKRTYDAYSLAPEFDFNYLLGREVGRANWSEEVLQEYLTIPDDPRYQQLAASLTESLLPQYENDAFAKAWSIKSYLDENGIYSLKNAHAYESDPAASFLFGDLTGYCMHFAFSATYLFRSLGIPARVGIGYSVPASNRAGGSSLLVQAIHGHAWPEIYFRDVGWVIVDPAPQQTLVDMTTDPQNDLQQLLGDMLRNDTSFEDFLDSQRSSSINITIILNTIYALTVLLLLAAYSIKLYRLWIPRHGNEAAQYRLSYRAILDRLSAIGLHRHYGESREEFAQRIAGDIPTIIKATDNHLASALGQKNIGLKNNVRLSDQQWPTLRAAIDKEIKQNVSSGRKVLALINPFSWLLTK